VKILINLQAGSVSVNEPGNTPSLSIQRLCWRKIYLETIEVVDPAFSEAASCGKAAPGGFVRPELTFSLVLTARIVTD
jgi:hypothetical protein